MEGEGVGGIWQCTVVLDGVGVEGEGGIWKGRG